jgi:hypothetical protein
MVHRLPGRDQRSAGDRSEAIIVVVEPGVYFVPVTQMASFLARTTASAICMRPVRIEHLCHTSR